MALKLRTVIFDHDARSAVVDLYGGGELADTACSGLEFILAHKPEAGADLGNGIWIIEMVGKGVWKTAVAYYSFDDNAVTIHDIVPA